MGSASTKVKPLKMALSHALPFLGWPEEGSTCVLVSLIPSIPTKVHTHSPCPFRG